MERILWIKSVFKYEFGFSDVRSNYSRVYSWITNQFGHLTLGMGVALVHYWLVQFVEFTADCIDSSFPRADATFIGFLTTGVLSGLVVIWLAKRDLRLSFLGLSAVFGTVFLSPWEFEDRSFFLDDAWLPYCSAGIYGAAVIVGGALLLVATRNRHLADVSRLRAILFYAPFDGAFYVIASVCLGAWFASASWFQLDGEWMVAAGGAIASMAVWSAKEYGGDMRTVRSELDDARKGRHQAGSNCDEGNGLDREYVTTALWDCRTDTMFYLIGAIIGAGLISGISAITGGADSWTFDLELIGVVAFFVFFVVVGRNWAYRQQGIDRTGAERGNMMAVIDFGIKILDSSGRQLSEPRLQLFSFARHDRNTCCTLEHIVVFGRGRHTEPLANALATEAALKSFPPEWYGNIGAEEARRRARKITFDRLWHYDPDNLDPQDLPYHPLWPLGRYIHTKNGLKRHVVMSQVPECKDAESWEIIGRIYPAQFVVVTQCDSSRLRTVLHKLKNEGQQTVWMFRQEDQVHEQNILCHLRYKFGSDAKIGVVQCF